MIDFTKVFDSNTICLRPMVAADKIEIEQLNLDKELWYHFTSDLSDMKVLSAWIDAAIKDIELKKRLALVIVDKETEKIIGSTSIGNIADRDKRCEIGWTWICRSYQGKGVNDIAKRLLLEYCFEQVKIERVEFKTDVLNKPARNALLRIHAIEEGVLRSHTLMTHSRRRDTLFYSILQSEWEGVKQKNGWL